MSEVRPMRNAEGLIGELLARVTPPRYLSEEHTTITITEAMAMAQPYEDKRIAAEKQAEEFRKLLIEREDADYMLRNLLAVIHGDGGHHTAAVGLEQSCEDAVTSYAGRVAKLREGLNGYALQSHADNLKWWHDPKTGQPIERNFGELISLCHSELSEALEGHRKDLMDDKLPHRKMVEVELADCLIRIFDLAGAYGYDLEGAYQEKRIYNANRADHTHEARLAEGGKKY